MSRRNGNGELDLKLNLSPPRVINHPQVESPSRSLTASPTSSCVSSDDSSAVQRYSDSPETITSMVLVGCPRCLMYVMLAEVNDPRCPKCKSTCLLDVMYEKNKTTRRNIS
nr:cyclin B2 [Nicotiana tabacum]UWU45286.1 cyclin B2 [Nicotiana tabacum]